MNSLSIHDVNSIRINHQRKKATSDGVPYFVINFTIINENGFINNISVFSDNEIQVESEEENVDGDAK